MKFSLVGLIVPQFVAGLKQYTNADKCAATTGTIKCQGAGGILDAAGAKTGTDAYAAYATIGQKDGATGFAEYWSGDLGGVYDTATNLAAGKGVICLTNSGASPATVPTSKTGSEACTKASDGSTTAAGTKAGWTGITKAVGMGPNGLAVLGATLSP